MYCTYLYIKNRVGAVFMVFSVVQLCRDAALGHYSMHIDQWCTLGPESQNQSYIGAAVRDEVLDKSSGRVLQ